MHFNAFSQNQVTPLTLEAPNTRKSQLKVLVLLNSPYPIGPVGSNRVHYIAKGLLENNLNVEILICHPTETEGNVKNPNREGFYEGVKYKYISPSTVRSRSKIVRKVKDWYCHLLVVLHVFLNKSHADINLVYGPAFDYRLVLPVVSWLRGTKIVLEINEYPLVTRKKSIITLMKRSMLFNQIFPLYHGFIAISETLATLVLAHKNKDALVLKVPILGNAEVSRPGVTPPIAEPYIIHAGSLSEEKDGILGIIEAFARAKDSIRQPISFVITGCLNDTEYHRAIRSLIEKHHLVDRVRFVGHLSKEDLARYLQFAQLAIVNKHDTMQNRYCFATKLIEYISYDIPVITTSVGESAAFLHDSISAYIVEPGDVDALAQRIVHALTHSNESKQLAANAKSLMHTEFNYAYQGRRIASLMAAIGPSRAQR